MKRLLCTIVLLFGVLRAVHGTPLLTYQEVSLGGGSWRYDYTATNILDPISQAGIDLFDLTFTFPLTPDVTSVPIGWDFILLGGSVETFSTNVGEPPFGTDIPPGASLSGFSFQFGEQVAAAAFTATFSNSMVLTGTAVNATVPEPNSAMLFGSTIGLFFVFRAITCCKRRASDGGTEAQLGG